MSDATNPSAVTEEELARAREYCKQLERQNIDWTSGTIIWQLALYARQEREAERERIETLESLLADAIEDLENGWTPRGGLIDSAKKQLADRMEAKK
jgi:hypothetical protein